MDVLLGGPNTRTADIVRGFLADRNDYPTRLRRVSLLAADDLFRAADMLQASSASL